MLDRKPRENLSRNDVRRVTRSLWGRLLTVILWLQMLLSAVRIVQQSLWLFRDFKPTGLIPYEMPILTGLLALYVLELVLSVMMAAGSFRLFFLQKPQGGRQLRSVIGFKRKLLLLLFLLTLCVTGFLVWLLIHYRLDIMLVGIVVVLALVICIALITGAGLLRNLRRILVDTNHALRTGCFSQTGGVFCVLRLQALILLILGLVPLAAVWLSSSIVQYVAGLIPGVQTEQLMRLLSSSVTSVGPMYAVDFLRTMLTPVCCLLLIPLYSRYCRCHGYTLRPLRRSSREGV